MTLVPKETALLVMDFTVQTCTPERRKRCADSVPKVKKFVEAAREHGALIIYSVAVPNSVATDVLKDLTPAAGEQVLPPLGPDKFINSDLEKTLKDKGIKTVVAMGTQAQTSVLHTGGEAALRGFKVIVPVDAMSADDLFPGSLHRLAPRQCGAHQQSGDADQARHDRVLSLLRRLRLQRVDLVLAAQRHHRDLAGAEIGQHDFCVLAVPFEQRDVARFGAARRQVERGPACGVKGS